MSIVLRGRTAIGVWFLFYAAIAASVVTLTHIIEIAPAHATAPESEDWVAKYTKDFDALNAFLKKPCLTDKDRIAASDKWKSADKALGEDIVDVANQIKDIQDQIKQINDSLQGFTPEYKAALASYQAVVEHSTHTVTPPPTPSLPDAAEMARLQKQLARLNDQVASLLQKLDGLKDIREQLHELYQDVIQLPDCPYDGSPPPPPSPPPAPQPNREPSLRCGTASHVEACPACKAEADRVNQAADAFSWAFGTNATCLALKYALTKLGRELSACVAKKCQPPDQRVPVIPGPAPRRDRPRQGAEGVDEPGSATAPPGGAPAETPLGQGAVHGADIQAPKTATSPAVQDGAHQDVKSATPPLTSPPGASLTPSILTTPDTSQNSSARRKQQLLEDVKSAVSPSSTTTLPQTGGAAIGREKALLKGETVPKSSETTLPKRGGTAPSSGRKAAVGAASGVKSLSASAHTPTTIAVPHSRVTRPVVPTAVRPKRTIGNESNR